MQQANVFVVEDSHDRLYQWTGILIIVLLITLIRIAFIAGEFRPLYGDEAQYWSWSQHLALGYYSKPPMVAWVIWLTTHIAGGGEFGVRLAAPLTHAITTLMIYLSGRYLYDQRVGFWAALTYLLLPGVSFSATIISTDPLLLMFWSIAFYGFIRAVDENRLIWWALCGVALGLALLSKYAAIAFPLSALLYLLCTRQKRYLLGRPGPYLCLILTLLVVAPNLWWNIQNHFASLQAVKGNAAINQHLFHPLNMLSFIASQFGVFGPILFAVLVIMLLRWQVVAKDQQQRLLLFLAIPLLATMTLEGLLHKANANWAAAAYVSATIAVAAYLLAEGKIRWLKAALIIHLGVAGLLYSFMPVVHAFNIKLSARTFPFKHILGWREAGAQVAVLRKKYPDTLLLANNRMLMAELLYYAKAPLSETFRWNEGEVNKKYAAHGQYAMVTDMNQALGRNFILISYVKKPFYITNHFAKVTHLPTIRIPILKSRDLTLYVFLLHDFLGYKTFNWHRNS